MSNGHIKITDILKTEYSDFVDFCSASGKCFVDELSGVDYVAFRSIRNLSREYVSKIRLLIENSSPSEESVDELNNLSQEVGELNFSEDTDRQNEVPKSDVLTNDINDNGIFRNHLIESDYQLLINDDQHSLSELFGANRELFINDKIVNLGLSVRSFNCLKRSGIHIISALLELKPTDLLAIDNMGVMSVTETLEKVKDYVSHNVAGTPAIIKSPTKKYFCESLQKAVRLMLQEEDYKGVELSAEDTLLLEELITAKDILGIELCQEAMDGSPVIKSLCDAMREFSIPYELFSKVKECAYGYVLSLPSSTKGKKAIPFIYAYTASTGSKLDKILKECDDDTTINDIPRIIDTFIDTPNADKLVAEINRFLCWLDFDINEVISDICQNMWSMIASKYPKTLDVFMARIEGKTLEEIGNSSGLSRERIRQLESKAHKAFWNTYGKQKYNVVMCVYALRDGDSVLFFDELKETIGDFASVIWTCVKKAQTLKDFSYSGDIDAIIIKTSESCFGADNLFDTLSESMNTIPSLIRENELNSIINNVLSSYQLPEELVIKHFNEQYLHDGQFYHRGRLTGTLMCDYVLKERFQSGFKIADDFEAGRFKQFMKEFFGEQGTNITNRALDAKIMDMGCLCDRGKYIHPDFMSVEKHFMEVINEYVQNSARNVIPYAEIYEDLRDKLNSSPIVNRYYLQGAIKKYGCEHKTTRDAIVKDASVSFADELESFVEERGITHKSEILAEFTSLSEATLGQVISRCSNVFNVDAGNYIHASVFDIQPSDYVEIRPILQKVTQEVPVSIRLLSDEIMSKCPDFFWRNNFEDRNKLFAALNYMFATEYSFSRPYIARLGVGEITTRSVILQHLRDYDIIDINELITICDENKIRSVSLPYLCQMLAPDFIRINETTLMRIELTGINDEVVCFAIENINEMLKTKAYIVASTFDDFLWFPSIEVYWNEFLLESIVVQSNKINIVNLVGDSLKHPNAVFVSDTFKNETFNSLLVRILKDEVKKGEFNSKYEMRDWLYEKRLIEGKLPSFLESSKYFYVDETGVHISGDGNNE